MSAGPLFNTETTVGVSGLGLSVVNFYVDQKTTVLNGSGTISVASGAGVLLGVIGLAGSLLSGQAGLAPPSNSGASILVFDGVSGLIPKATSGNSSFAANTAGVFYQFSFGTASGVGTGGVAVGPPDLTGINAIFKSGLQAVCSGGPGGGFGISLLWSKAA